MNSPLRVIDTGEMSARWNVAMTAVLTELHRDGRIADTLRFHRYPASVLVGRHQLLAQAAHIDRCHAAGVELARRLTGGGAVYMAPGALAWDLVIARKAAGTQLDHAAAMIGKAVAAALATFCLPARYRPQNEVEIGGRKICGMSGYYDGGTLVYQGTILIDTSLADMAKFLRLPSDRAQSLQRDLKDRLTNLADAMSGKPEPGKIEKAIARTLSQAFGRVVQYENPGREESALANEWHRTEFGLESFVNGIDTQSKDRTMIGRAGSVEAYIKLVPGSERLIDQIWLTGNFTALPSRAIPDLEAALRGMPIRSAPGRSIEILTKDSVEIYGASRNDVAAAIAAAREAGADISQQAASP